ncbi:hypothetical protein DSYM_01100 [Candidatus Desulfobacillus denitrificans]|uniref:Uncharacterized protein n=1 Tax=Candidatus Desulfobacillus denitrificans TaxID=2608985 RepID=A0A809S1K0_9PROT|nr:hypothetical protein DSYM_01100 [Candidatus Desulfobacillus denitrificans]
MELSENWVPALAEELARPNTITGSAHCRNLAHAHPPDRSGLWIRPPSFAFGNPAASLPSGSDRASLARGLSV